MQIFFKNQTLSLTSEIQLLWRKRKEKTGEHAAMLGFTIMVSLLKSNYNFFFLQVKSKKIFSR